MVGGGRVGDRPDEDPPVSGANMTSNVGNMSTSG